MSSFKSVLALGLLATAQLVAGHGAIIKAVGNAGGEGSKCHSSSIRLLYFLLTHSSSGSRCRLLHSP